MTSILNYLSNVLFFSVSSTNSTDGCSLHWANPEKTCRSLSKKHDSWHWMWMQRNANPTEAASHWYCWRIICPILLALIRIDKQNWNPNLYSYITFWWWHALDFYLFFFFLNSRILKVISKPVWNLKPEIKNVQMWDFLLLAAPDLIYLRIFIRVNCQASDLANFSFFKLQNPDITYKDK